MDEGWVAKNDPLSRSLRRARIFVDSVLRASSGNAFRWGSLSGQRFFVSRLKCRASGSKILRIESLQLHLQLQNRFTAAKYPRLLNKLYANVTEEIWQGQITGASTADQERIEEYVERKREMTKREVEMQETKIVVNGTVVDFLPVLVSRAGFKNP